MALPDRRISPQKFRTAQKQTVHFTYRYPVRFLSEMYVALILIFLKKILNAQYNAVEHASTKTRVVIMNSFRPRCTVVNARLLSEMKFLHHGRKWVKLIY